MNDDQLAATVADLTELADGHELFADIEDDAMRRAYMWGCARGYRESAARITDAITSQT